MKLNTRTLFATLLAVFLAFGMTSAFAENDAPPAPDYSGHKQDEGVQPATKEGVAVNVPFEYFEWFNAESLNQATNWDRVWVFSDPDGSGSWFMVWLNRSRETADSGDAGTTVVRHYEYRDGEWAFQEAYPELTEDVVDAVFKKYNLVLGQ